MSRLNATWHKAHPMPRNATLDQRVRWHLAHARACACRAIPGTILAELRARRITPPKATRLAIVLLAAALGGPLSAQTAADSASLQTFYREWSTAGFRDGPEAYRMWSDNG